MGGHALKTLNTIRLNKDDYFVLLKDVLSKLEGHFGLISDIPAYRQKESFGDMDVLVSNYLAKKPVAELFKDLFCYNEIKHNGGVYSFDYHNFQIDLILVNERIHNVARTYFSYNDCGNLMGRIFHKFGLSYGHEGLYYVYRKNITQVLEEIEISLDPSKFFGFAGYDYNRWNKGFETLEDIFVYATSTPYFNKDIFSFENLNHINRTRNRKRTSYQAFVAWLESKTFDNFNFHENKDFYLPDIFRYFKPERFKEKYDKATEKYNRDCLIRSKFNGEIVSSITGLKDKELGLFIVKLKTSFDSKEKFEQWVLDSPPNSIKEFILLNNSSI